MANRGGRRPYWVDRGQTRSAGAAAIALARTAAAARIAVAAKTAVVADGRMANGEWQKLSWPMGRQAIIRGKDAHLLARGINSCDSQNLLTADSG
jgi:hypothetical protein